MGDMKINPTISDDFRKKFEEDLTKSAETLKEEIGNVEVALQKMSKEGASAYNTILLRSKSSLIRN
jgi:hypothetical protein